MDTLIVIFIVAVAVVYLGYTFWPGRQKKPGCAGCSGCSCGTGTKLDDMRNNQGECSGCSGPGNE